MGTREWLLDRIQKYTGDSAFFLIISAFLVGNFGELIKGHGTFSNNILPFITIFSTILLILGLTSGFAHFINKRFQMSFGKYLLDGLVAGLIAGLIGGLFYALEDNIPSSDSVGFRLIRILTLAIPIGGLYGMTLGLLNPEQNPYWRKRLNINLIFGLIVLIPAALFGASFGGKWSSNADYVPGYVIMMIVGIFIMIMATVELNSQINIFSRKFLRWYLICFMFLIGWGYLFYGLGLLVNVDLINIEYLPTKSLADAAPIMIATGLLFTWSLSYFYLVTIMLKRF